MRRDLILNDWHCPAHNRPYLDGMFKFVYLNRDYITSIVLNGDILDTYSVAKFSRGEQVYIDLGNEYNLCNGLLDLFDEACGGKISVKFNHGNHEHRVAKLSKNAEFSKLGTALMGVNTGLRLVERHYQIFDDPQEPHYKIGNIDITHGDFANKYSAEKHCMTYMCNVIVGHTHRNQYYDFGKFAAWTIGGMMDIQAKNHFDYVTPAQKGLWGNSHGVIDTEGDMFNINIVKYFNGKGFLFEGKSYI